MPQAMQTKSNTTSTPMRTQPRSSGAKDWYSFLLVKNRV